MSKRIVSLQDLLMHQYLQMRPSIDRVELQLLRSTAPGLPLALAAADPVPRA